MSEILTRERTPANGGRLDRGGQERDRAGAGEAGVVLYALLASAGALRLEGWVRPGEFHQGSVSFPGTKCCTATASTGNGIELTDPPEAVPEQIVIGAHPCDAAAGPMLDQVFNWDYRDEAYNRRRAATTVVTVACASHDEQCFCTSVGLGPADECGSDAMLFEQPGRLGGSRPHREGPAPFRWSRLWLARAPNARAGAIRPCADRRFREGTIRFALLARARASLPGLRRLRLHLPDLPLLRHRGRGQCAGEGYARPQLGCLPVSDLHPARLAGTIRAARRRSGSGSASMHKFSIYPEKFGEILCTGCGNCARNCPAGLGILTVLTEIQHADIYTTRPDGSGRRPAANARRQIRALRFRDPERASHFDFRVGQFGIFSAFGYGESTFNICSSSNWKDRIEFCFRKVGRVTEALWRVEEGDTLGFRGPYGNGYPMEEWRGHDLIFLGGGIAMPPIRCAVWYALENRADYGEITIVYGARTVARPGLCG